MPEDTTEKSSDDQPSAVKPTVAKESPWRSLTKALSWRVVGTLDTFLLSFVIIKYLAPYLGLAEELHNTTIATTAASIAVAEILTKIIIYTTHERIWNWVTWGVKIRNNVRYEARRRSFAKTATWRVTASLDTMLLAWFFTGNIATAFSIGSLEVITKLILYFFHERLWQKIPLGIKA